MTVTCRTNEAGTIRRYLVIPNDRRNDYEGQPLLSITVGNIAPGIESSYVEIAHNDETRAYTIRSCIDELNTCEATHAEGIPEFEAEDLGNWENILDHYEQKFNPPGTYRYISKISLKDSDATTLSVTQLLEVLLERLVNHGVIYQRDVQQLVLSEDRAAGVAGNSPGLSL